MFVVLLVCLACIYFFVALRKRHLRHCDLRMNDAGCSVSTCAVLGSGGHTAEMLRILQALDINRYKPLTLLLANNDQLSMAKVDSSNLGMAEAYAQANCRKVVYHMAQIIGFHNGWTTALDGMANLLIGRICALSKGLAHFSNAYGRTQPILDDYGLVLSWMGISLLEIVDFVKQVDMAPAMKNAPSFPVHRPLRLQYRDPSVDDDESKHSNDYIPSYLPRLELGDGKSECAVDGVATEIAKSVPVVVEKSSLFSNWLDNLESMDAFSVGLVKMKEIVEEPVADAVVEEKMRQITLDDLTTSVVNEVVESQMLRARSKKARVPVSKLKPKSSKKGRQSSTVSRAVSWVRIKDVISQVLEQTSMEQKAADQLVDAPPSNGCKDVAESSTKDNLLAVESKKEEGAFESKRPKVKRVKVEPEELTIAGLPTSAKYESVAEEAPSTSSEYVGGEQFRVIQDSDASVNPLKIKLKLSTVKPAKEKHSRRPKELKKLKIKFGQFTTTAQICDEVGQADEEPVQRSPEKKVPKLILKLPVPVAKEKKKARKTKVDT